METHGVSNNSYSFISDIGNSITTYLAYHYGSDIWNRTYLCDQSQYDYRRTGGLGDADEEDNDNIIFNLRSSRDCDDCRKLCFITCDESV